jgi:hypothetical protein
MNNNPLDILENWFEHRKPALESVGISASITWGPRDRNPASAWVDFESATRSARLIVWSNGGAELVIGDLPQKEVLLEEHRDVWTEVGLNDAAETVTSWLATESDGPLSP